MNKIALELVEARRHSLKSGRKVIITVLEAFCMDGK